MGGTGTTQHCTVGHGGTVVPCCIVPPCRGRGPGMALRGLRRARASSPTAAPERSRDTERRRGELEQAVGHAVAAERIRGRERLGRD